jgi:hypothetical protein
MAIGETLFVGFFSIHRIEVIETLREKKPLVIPKQHTIKRK